MDQDAETRAFHLQLNASIGETLLREARANELTLSYVRVVAIGLIAIIDYLLYAQPFGLKLLYVFSVSTFYLAIFWFVASLTVMVALRRGWYPPWCRMGLAFFDGLMVFSHAMNVFLAAGTKGMILMPLLINTAIACSLLAVSGSLRMTKAATGLTTLLAAAIFLVIAHWAEVPLLEMIFTAALLCSVGFFGMWMSDLVRRCVEGEVGRLVLERFLPKEVVDGAYHKPSSIITEPSRMNVTIVISDLRGFTAYAEKLSPEQVFAHLNSVQSLLATTVEAYDGKIDKFMGDGILAVFGTSSKQVNHASLGIQAAFAMVAEAKKLAVLTQTPIRLGVGVHSGPVMVGCIGRGKRVEFTVLGDTVNTASRLQELTKEKGVEILISGESWLQATSSGSSISLPTLIPQGNISIRGRESSLEVFTGQTT